MSRPPGGTLGAVASKTEMEVGRKMADFEITRRHFNKGLAGAAVSVVASAGPLARSVLGANDRIGVGLIGAGGMGQFDLRDFLRSGQVDAVAIADPFQPQLRRAPELPADKPKAVQA